ncbi:MAG: metallophosphoesterase [Arcticibacter sp.]
MKRTAKLLILILLFGLSAQGQDSVRHRMIFIGDAGEINHKQETIIPYAAQLILPGKTTVMYLGDNVYPSGVGLPGSADEVSTRDILRSQYRPMRAAGAPVYFIPGNHDWDRMGKQGLAKIKAQWEFLQAQGDSLLMLVPADGCPDPVEIPLSDKALIIAYDSEWWVFPHDKKSDDADCACNSAQEVIDRMKFLLNKNKNKTIFLAGHHPIWTYGVHGGHYSWKDHIFPLTAKFKNLWIPLPGIGSLYPLLRNTLFLNPEDSKHPAYKNLVRNVNSVFKGFENVIYVSGHDHGLQLINEEKLQIVSGAGAKQSYAGKGKNSLYSQAEQGFVTVDLLSDRSSRITFYGFSDASLKRTFVYVKPYEPAHGQEHKGSLNKVPWLKEKTNSSSSEAAD